MKKCKKIIAALLLISICLVSAGCVSVEDLRKTHGIWTDESHSVIELNGQAYKRLPYDEEIFNMAECTSINVTEKDVPLLLAGNTYYGGSYYDLSENEIIIEDWTGEYNNTYFCRSDYYDEIVGRLQKGVDYTLYGYTYYDYEIEGDTIYELTDAQAKAINHIINNKSLLFTPASVDEYGYDYGPSIQCYSEDLLFEKYYCDICYEYEDDGYLLIIEDEGSSQHYKVPAKFNSIFEEILVAYESY